MIYIVKTLKEIEDEEELPNVKQVDINYIGENGSIVCKPLVVSG